MAETDPTVNQVQNSNKGIGVEVFEDLRGEAKRLDLATLPDVVRVVIENIDDSKSSIFYGGKALVSWHCWKRMHVVEYSPGSIGTVGWEQTKIKVCEICGAVNKRTWEDLSGIPF